MVASSPQQAVSNGHAVSTYDRGMCQKFVRDQCWRVPSLYGSAIEAWNGARHKHPGDRTPPVGAPTYYRGGEYGHAVIYCGGSHQGIRSTDCQSAYAVSDTDVGWPERAWGYVYLGWTEDINGVRVITGDTPPPEPEEDEVPEYVRVTMDGRNLPGEWVPIVWDSVPGDSTGKAANEGEASLRIGGRRYVATLTAQVTLAGSDSARTRTTEGDCHTGNWATVETNPTAEHPATSGDTYIVDTRAGSCRSGDDMRLRWEVTGPEGSSLVRAECQLVYW